MALEQSFDKKNFKTIRVEETYFSKNSLASFKLEVLTLN